MTLVGCNKDYIENINSLSNDYSYIINKKNNIIYFSTEQGISLECVVDLNFNPNSKGIFIYEDFGNVDTINIVFINNIQQSINFIIDKQEKSFNLKKIENLIKAICVQHNIFNVYYFENSTISNNISLPNFVTIGYKSRSDFRKISKKNGKLKTNQNKIIFLITFCILAIVVEFSMNQMVSYLSNKSRESFNVKNTALETQKNNLLIELQKYENLAQNLKDISVVSSVEDYLVLKKQIIESQQNQGNVQ